jgi:hypothetical protein
MQSRFGTDLKHLPRKTPLGGLISESPTRHHTSSLTDNNNKKGRQLLFILRLYISVALQQKTANFKVAIMSRPMQWSALP